MVEDIFFGTICILVGSFAVVAWWFAMFSDSDWGGLASEGLSGIFSLGRNTVAVIEPAVGLFLLLGGLFGLSDPLGIDDDSPIRLLFGAPALASLVVAVLGLIPFRLPGWMYPEWQLERRRRRAQGVARANWDHGDGGVASWGRHAARPEPTTGVDGHDGQHAGDAGGEDPLKSSDSLLTRAHLTHPDDQTSDPQ